MKIWIDKCNLKWYLSDSSVKLGIGWYRHSKDHKWLGFTIEIYLYFWLVNINYVSSYKEYYKKIGRKYKYEIRLETIKKESEKK